MSKQARLEEIVKQFETGGLATIMTTPPKTIRFLGNTSTRQSSRNRSNHLEMETRREVPITLIPTYLSSKESGAPNLQLTKNVKYLIPLLPMSKDVKEEGDLLGNISGLKYRDNNLQALEKFPQF